MFDTNTLDGHRNILGQPATEHRRNKKVQLPGFDELSHLYKTDPVAFEQLRTELCEQMIENAPERIRQRLRGIQFKIDMTRRKARSPMSACLSLSKLMQESLHELREALNNPGEYLRNRSSSEATILPFYRNA